MKRLFEELTVSDHLRNVYNKRQQLGNMNKAFTADGNSGEVTVDMSLEEGTGPLGSNGGAIGNGGLANGGTVTPPMGVDINLLLPVVQHQQQQHHHNRKVSVKHSVAGPWLAPQRGEGNELNILRGALLQNKLSGVEMVSKL